ncbi:MAG: Ycf66 family protein [Xenococcaceae cyanobacterium]
MVNVSFYSSTGLLGLLNILGAVAYLIILIAQIANTVRTSGNSINIIIKILELIYCPLALFLSGIILIFAGWRLDPILQFQQLLLEILVAFLVIKDILRR